MSTSACASPPAGRGLAVLLAVALAAAALLLAAPPARGIFDRLEVDPGQYTGTNLYVPGETMVITIYADPGDVYDIEIFHWALFGPRTTRHTIDDQTIPASGHRTNAWVIPDTLEDSPSYWVGVYGPNWFESGTGPTYDLYPFEVRGYDFYVWTDRPSYLPGDTVHVSWSAILVRDGSPAPDGVGSLQVVDDAGTPLISEYNFTTPQGTQSFALSTSANPNLDARAYAWFNDTAGNRMTADTQDFDIDAFGVLASTDRGLYAPGSLVTLDVSAKITDFPGNPRTWEPGAPGAVVNITVSDLATGGVLPYGAQNLVTDGSGNLAHVFVVDTEGSYEIQVQATAHGALTAATATTFEVRNDTTLSVTVTLDKAQYLAGETARATASVYRVPPATYTYTWAVLDAGTGRVLELLAGATASFDFAIPSDFSGTLRFMVEANDGNGGSATGWLTVEVAFGYLAVTLNPYEYDAGQTITGSYSFTGSSAMSSPTYYYEILDASGYLVQSGTMAGASVTYLVPNPASPSYTFRIAATQGGRVVSGSAQAHQVSGYVMSISTDKEAYAPGETIRVHYAIRARGASALPREFFFMASLYGSSTVTHQSTQAEGDIAVPIPGGSNDGDLLLVVSEASTGAMAFETVRVGSTNPLWDSKIAGIPSFAVLLGLLVALLFVLVLFLWRRGGMGAAAREPLAPGKAAPPPPPTGPAPSTSPMSVACRHCGKPIEITTSKRPIEVMCPACGETQLVQ